MKPIQARTLFRPSPGLFFPALDAADKKDLFAALVDALAEQGIASHRDALLKVLLEREAVGTTGVGSGIAIPHVRSMVVESTAVCFARLPGGLDFAAADGEPVRVVYLIVAPYGVPGALYLPLLGVFAAASRRKADRRRLLAVESYDDFAGLMSRFIQPLVLEGLEK